MTWSRADHGGAVAHQFGDGLAVARAFQHIVGDQRHRLGVVELDAALAGAARRPSPRPRPAACPFRAGSGSSASLAASNVPNPRQARRQSQRGRAEMASEIGIGPAQHGAASAASQRATTRPATAVTPARKPDGRAADCTARARLEKVRAASSRRGDKIIVANAAAPSKQAGSSMIARDHRPSRCSASPQTSVAVAVHLPDLVQKAAGEALRPARGGQRPRCRRPRNAEPGARSMRVSRRRRAPSNRIVSGGRNSRAAPAPIDRDCVIVVVAPVER